MWSFFGGPKEAPTEQLSYHYHPAPRAPEPHLHVSAEADWVHHGALKKKHLPTGRVSVEDFIELLIVEFGVRHRREDWQEVLDKNRAVFKERKTW